MCIAGRWRRKIWSNCCVTLGQQEDLSTGQQSALSGCCLGETGGEAAATIIFASGALAGAAATSLQLCQSTTGIVVIFAGIDRARVNRIPSVVITNASKVKRGGGRTGNVGSEFLALLATQQQAFAGQIELKLAGVFNSRQACFADELSVQNWPAVIGNSACLPKTGSAGLSNCAAQSKSTGRYHPEQSFCRRLY